MSANNQKDENRLTFRECLNLICRYLSQPIGDPNYKFIFNFQEFKKHFLQLQLLERCWNLECAQFLEHCWNLEFKPETTQR
ncbi:hypothetical protein Ple7327_0337 [Pleurocapsa sp. PCC 7327]|nr:hypothetical protein Ple7327_0337 [Pleurocapsa sp. PCC 7327]